MADITRSCVLHQLNALKLDWGDEEDAIELVDLLCKAFSPQQVLTLIFFHCSSLGTTPLLAVEQGRVRDVFKFARALVEDEMSSRLAA